MRLAGSFYCCHSVSLAFTLLSSWKYKFFFPWSFHFCWEMFLSSEWRWQNKNTVVGIRHTRQAAFCSGAVRKYPTEMAQNFQQETSKAGCYPGNKSGPRGRGLRMRIMLLETDLAAPYRHRVQNSEEVSAPKGTEVALERPLGRRSWAEVEL